MNRPFPNAELDARRARLRARLVEAGLDGIVVSQPENIYYLTGLDHWGYFACHLLIVPLDGEMVLVARAMEGVTIANQVQNARFLGHADYEDVADFALRAIGEAGLTGCRLGLEMRSLFLTPRVADAIRSGATGCQWSDGSGIIDVLRLIKSPLEMEYTRQAAAAADAGTLAAIEAIRDGATDNDVAAACHAGMISAGSEYPGFGPFIRPTRRLGEEHTTWCGDRFGRGDAVFLELAGAVRKYQAPMGRLVYVGEAPAGADASVELAIRGMEAIRAAPEARRACRRGLFRLARRCRLCRPCRLSQASLRLPRVDRFPAYLDRRIVGDRARSELAATASGRHDVSCAFMVHQYGARGLLHLQHRDADGNRCRGPDPSHARDADHPLKAARFPLVLRPELSEDSPDKTSRGRL